MRKTVYFLHEDGSFHESNVSRHLGYIEYITDDNSTNYRWNNHIHITQLNIDLFGWNFSPDIHVVESSNYNDEYQIKFCIDSVSPSGKAFNTEFKGRYLYNKSHNSAIEAVLTAIFLIATTGNPNCAKELYEYVLTYPMLPRNAKAFINTFVNSLNKLLAIQYKLSFIRTDTIKSKEFYNYVVSVFNHLLKDFSDNISKYISYAFIKEKQ